MPQNEEYFFTIREDFIKAVGNKDKIDTKHDVIALYNKDTKETFYDLTKMYSIPNKILNIFSKKSSKDDTIISKIIRTINEENLHRILTETENVSGPSQHMVISLLSCCGFADQYAWHDYSYYYSEFFNYEKRKKFLKGLKK